MTNAKLDQNSRPTLTALSSTDGTTIVPLYADPTTHRLLVDMTGGGTGNVVGPASSTDNAIVRFDGITGELIQNSGVILNDTNDLSGIRSIQLSGSVPSSPAIGTLWFDSTNESLNFQQNNTTLQIGEEMFVYGKASEAINDSPLQIIYKTGTVGASGVLKFAPTIAGITNANDIIGAATESIVKNNFGRITSYGVIHNITTDGAAYGEVWADNDVIWYDPVTGNPTKVKPSAPNIKLSIGTVINAGSGGSGSFFVNIGSSSVLGGTDANVQFGALANQQLIQYDSVVGYWKNVAIGSGSGIQPYLASQTTVSINYVIDGGGATITTGSKGYIEIPYAMTITGWVITADQSGDIVVDVKKSSYAGFPTTSSIAGSELPTLSTAQKNEDLNLTTWTTSVSAGDILEFVVNSAATVQRVTVSLVGNKT